MSDGYFRGETSISDHVQFDWAGDTVVGKVRRVNEDSYGCQVGLFVVADGMGGHQAGDVASQIVVDQFVGGLASVPVAFDLLKQVILSANSEVRSQAVAVGQLGMGATLVALVWVVFQSKPYLAVVNVGDSRCYVSDRDGFRRVTHDHSLVQDLLDSGAITAAEARTHPERNVITRAIGVDPHVTADYVLLPATGQQRILLCSDGVSTQLDDEVVHRIVVDAVSPEAAVSGLLEAVMDGQAPDNATAVVVDATWVVDQTVVGDDGQTTNPRGLITNTPLPPPLPNTGAPSRFGDRADPFDADTKRRPPRVRGVASLISWVPRVAPRIATEGFTDDSSQGSET